MQSLQTITTKQLRDELSEILERVAIGQQEFIVTKFGRKKAKLSPVKAAGRVRKKKVDLRTLSAYGMWRNRDDIKNSAQWVAEMRRKQSFRIRDSK